LRKTNSLQPVSNLVQNLVVFSLCVFAAIVALMLKAPDKWLAAIYETVCVFPGMIFFFRVRWRYSRFWLIITACFLLHLGITWLVFAVWLRSAMDVSLGTCIPFIFLEAAALYYSVRFLEPRLPGQSSRAVKKGF
jgi:hypothetical protein